MKTCTAASTRYWVPTTDGSPGSAAGDISRICTIWVKTSMPSPGHRANRTVCKALPQAEYRSGKSCNSVHRSSRCRACWRITARLRASNNASSTRSASTIDTSLTSANRCCNPASSKLRLANRSIPNANVLRKTGASALSGSLMNNAPASSALPAEPSSIVSLSTLGKVVPESAEVSVATSDLSHRPSSLVIRASSVAYWMSCVNLLRRASLKKYGSAADMYCFPWITPRSALRVSAWPRKKGNSLLR